MEQGSEQGAGLGGLRVKVFTRIFALLGVAALLTLGIFLFNILRGPTQCRLTGAPIRFAAPASANPNRDLVVNFYTQVILNGQLHRASAYLRPDYIQHNPDAGQGLSGFVAYFTKIKQSLEAKGATRHGEITMAFAQGDLVTVYVTSVIDGRVSASFRAIDIFRVQGGIIAEHWDSIQPCDTRSALLLALNR